MAMGSGIPRLQRVGQSVQLMVDGKPLLLAAGEVRNSASSCLRHMEQVYGRCAAMNCNAAFVPITWELVEPQEQGYDWSLVEGLLEGARRHGLRLVPLWFGTYKNAASTYVPGWVKQDRERFPRQQAVPGRDTGSVSVCCEEARRCDARAFAALMEYLRSIDAGHRTVVMVQVENEVGMLGGSRDRCPLAEKAFAGAAPTELMRYLQANAGALREELKGPWERAGGKSAGSWQEVFGSAADEVFMAWHFGRFVGTVAAAGREKYDLPMYANAWLVQHEGQVPGDYPSGGPVAKMIDVWRAAAPAPAPSLDLLAPDIYIEDFKGVCAEYSRGGNPLLIPEARRDEAMAARAFYAFGQRAIAFSPFAFEDTEPGMPEERKRAAAFDPAVQPTAGESLAECYRLVREMMPVITEASAAGRMAGVLHTVNPVEMVELGGYRLRIEYRPDAAAGPTSSGGLICSPGDGEFVVAGMNLGVRFLPAGDTRQQVDFLEIWEGEYKDGKFVRGRRFNGDEYSVQIGKIPGVRLVKVYMY